MTAGLLVLGSSPLTAADATQEADRGAAEIFDAVTVVASRVEEPVGEIAGTASVVDRATMDRLLVQEVGDALRYEPGVSVTRQAGRFGASGFRVRGIEGNRVAIELDGTPLPEAFAVGSFSNAGRDVVDPELLRSVEILRGPASAVHGSDALGGIVALTTRSPTDLLDGGEDGVVGLRVSGDSRDDGVRTSVLGALDRGRWQILALAARRTGSEVDNRGDVAPDPAASEERSAFVRLVRTFGSGFVELTLDRDERALATDVRHLVHGPAQFATTERLSGDDRVERTRGALLYRFGSDAGGLTDGRARLSWSDSETVQITAQERSADARTRFPTRRDRRFDLGEEALSGEWTATSHWTTSSTDHRLVWGVEARSSTIRERRDGSETNLATGERTSIVLGEDLPVRDFPVSEVRRLGVYLVDDFAFGAAGRWRLQPALRFDRVATRARADRLYREDFPAIPAVDIDESSWTPKLGLTRDLGHGHSLYAQYAEGFRAPPFYDVNVGLKITVFNYQAIPNPDLRPERSRGLELGWRFAGARASGHLALYDNHYRDLIESRANLGSDPATGATLFQSINRDRARIYGAEGRLRLDLSRLAARADGWTLDAGLSWAKGEDTRRDQPLNTVDPARATVGLAYSAPGGRWSASAVGTLVADKRGEVDVSTADVFAPPGYAVVDLYGEWRAERNWTVTVALLNGLDRKYWTFGDARGVLAGDPQLDFHTAPGRAILLGLAYRR